MIIINLKGGTGNQLFQYALGRHLALKNNDTLKLSIAGLAQANSIGDIYRPFALSALNTQKEIATAAEVQKLKNPYGLISKAWRFFNFKVLRRFNIVFNPKVLSWQGDIYLDGFWQSPLYFEAIRDVLLKDLTLTSPFSPEAAEFAAQIKNSTAVSLHVRRGDYIKNPQVAADFGICSTEYYTRAINKIKETVINPTFFVFSDDMDWVRKNLPVGNNAVFVTGTGITDVEEIMLMSLCQHNIIANSSFSWWGAWLNQNSSKIVVAPTPWLNRQPYDANLIPPAWIQIQK
jgi:Glycosyl transferase family 11